MSRTLAELGLQSIDIYQGLQEALSAVRIATGSAMRSVVGLRQNEDQARLAVARAVGASSVLLESGNVPMTVNRVLARLYSADRTRYERALRSARQAAYVARLAIEQRLGVRLSTLTNSSVGLLEPPATWADDVCSLTGIDFEGLADTADGAMADLPQYGGYANEYVGDYVSKLREFVDYYNIQYPSQEGRDVAVVSLRDDVQNEGDTCVAETKNLLYYSDDLSVGGAVDSEGAARGGWSLTECGDTCVRVSRFLADEDGAEIVVDPPIDVGAASWVTNVAPSGTQGEDGRLPATLYQSVELAAGASYVLSWWDIGVLRDQASVPAVGEGSFVVGIYNAEWEAEAVSVVELDALGEWSERRALIMAPAVSGTYHVAITADGLGEELALGIANVQLEGSLMISGPSEYSPTTGTRMELSGDCGRVDPSSWRGMFTRHCTDGECYYELNKPLAIDSEAIAAGLGALSSRFAPGNLNYRLGAVSVNLVGTGVLDCSEDSRMSCYGTGYIEFELEHSASNAKILNLAGSPQCFDFKRAGIRGGKALAAERMITNPMSSADQALLGQDAFRKIELAGRPLDGLYTLRIKDSPALRWEQVEDIQLIFNYSYWSEVEAIAN